MIEIFTKQSIRGKEWVRVTRQGDTEKIEALLDTTSSLSKEEAIKKLDLINA